MRENEDFTAQVLQSSRSNVQFIMNEFGKQLNTLVSAELGQINSCISNASRPPSAFPSAQPSLSVNAFNQSMFAPTPMATTAPNDANMQLLFDKLASISSMLEQQQQQQQH